MHDLFGNAYERKTEPLGIPYMGSKRKYANALITRMMELQPNARYLYDLFGGGGAMSFAAMQKGLIVHYNELQTDMCELMRYIFNPTPSKFGMFPEEYYNFVTREKFYELRNENGLYAQFARICYSFGNNQKGYAFSPDIEPLKHLAHNVVMFQCEQSMAKVNEILRVELQVSNKATWNERRLEFGVNIKANKKRLDLQQFQQLQRLQQFQRLQRLQQFQRLQRLTITNLDYRDVKITTPINKTIVYCDIPYRGTAKYVGDFNHAEFDAWFASLPYTAFLSEYSAPFQCVNEIKTRSTLSSINNSCAKIEKLYINHPSAHILAAQP
jgi:site-specific DNA-adenine methylase